jgi:hypothetical protein
MTPQMNLNNANNNNLNPYAKSTTTTLLHHHHLIDNIRGQQPHSSRAGGSGMQGDRRNMMNDRRMNPMMVSCMHFKKLMSNLTHILPTI